MKKFSKELKFFFVVFFVWTLFFSVPSPVLALENSFDYVYGINYEPIAKLVNFLNDKKSELEKLGDSFGKTNTVKRQTSNIANQNNARKSFLLSAVLNTAKDSVVGKPKQYFGKVFCVAKDFVFPGTCQDVAGQDYVSATAPKKNNEEEINALKKQYDDAIVSANELNQKFNLLQQELGKVKAGGVIIKEPIIEQKTVERTIEKIVSGLSQDDLSASIASIKTELNNLNTNLTNQINNLSFNTSRQSTAAFQAISLTNKIDSLSGTRLSGIIVNGVSGLTNADIPDDITASNYLPLTGGTVSGDLTITGNATLGVITLQNATAGYFMATSTAQASTFPYASTTALTVAGDSWFGGLSTITNLLLAGSTTLQNFTANNSTTTNATTTNLAISGSAYIGSLNGPLQANNGLVSATTSVGYQYGGTGLTATPSFGQILRGTGTGYALTATSTLGINTTDITEGSNLFWTNDRFDNRLSATTTLPNLTTLANLSITGSQVSNLNTLWDNRMSATTSLQNITTLASLASIGTITSGIWNGSSIGNAYVDNDITLTNLTQITNRAISDTTGTLAVARGGTGQTSFGQGWLNSDGTTLSASTSPTVNYITATSTTATSTLATGGLTVGVNQFVVQQNSGNVGIGTTSPSVKLSVGGVAGDETGHGYFTGGLGVGILNTVANSFRVGQCVTGDTKLRRRRRRKIKSQISNLKSADGNGDYIYDEVAIKDIEAGDEIASLDTKTNKIVWSKVKQLAYMGKKQTYRLSTEDGRQIRTTANHPYLTEQGWVKVSDLRQGMPIAVPRDKSKQKPRVGVFVDNANIFYAQKKKNWKVDYNRLKTFIGNEFNIRLFNLYAAMPKQGDEPARHKTQKYLDKISNFAEIITKPLKYIPERIHFEDGAIIERTMKKGNFDVEITKDVLNNLADVDVVIIVSGDSDFVALRDDVWSKNKEILFITFKDSLAFELKNGKYFTFEKLRKWVEFGQKNTPELLCGGTLLPLLYSSEKDLSNVSVKTPVDNSITWAKIRSIEPVAEEDVYDIEIENTHNFIGNDIIAHNTAFTVGSDGKTGVGTTSPVWKLSVAGIGSFDDFVRSSYFTATSTTASTFPYASTTAFTISGSAYIGSLNGPLQANNGLVSATTSVGYQYGGTGLTATPSFGQILRGNGTGYALTATSTLGINTNDLTEGSNLFWTNDRFDNRLSATTTLPNLTTLLGLTNASTTALTVTGQTTLATSLTGLIKATSGVISAITTSLGLAGEISDETGSGALVFGTSPTFTTQITTPSIISAGALGITPASGSNLNVNLAGTGDFAVNTNQLYVDTSTGYVGIGTTTAARELHVSGTDASFLIGNDIDLTTDNQLGFKILPYTTNGSVYVDTKTVTGGALLFRIGEGTEVGSARTWMAVDSTNGKVGIGTTTPGAKLDVYAGNIDIDNTTNANQYGVITKNGTRFIHNFNYGNNGTVTTAGFNTFVGENAGNLTMGSTATSAYEGSYNTGVGYQSLFSNTTGSRNTANGYTSLYSNTTGYYNTANGMESLASNTTGYYNTASGLQSLYSNTTGYQNTSNGMNSLYSNTTGTNNTALGFQAGYNSGTALQTNTNSVFIGDNANSSVDGLTNAIAIGSSAQATQSNQVVLGNSSITQTLLRGNVGIGTTTPNWKLSVAGIGSFDDFVRASYFTATSTTATSTFAGGLSVAGHCVTGDTKLRRRRKKKNGEGYDYDEVEIKDIQVGDEIASLDEETGKIVWSKVNALMDMGVKKIYKLTTVSGKTIRTTAEHPYFIKNNKISSKKAIAFIDYANIKAWARNKKLAIDMKALKEILSAVGVNDAMFYYGVDIKNEKMAGFIDVLKKIGYQTITKPLQYFRVALIDILNQSANINWMETLEKSLRENLIKEAKTLDLKNHKLLVPKANFDVEITIDALKNISKFDTFLFFSGDGDFTPLIQKVNESGKNTAVIAGREFMSATLRETAKIHVKLEDIVKIVPQIVYSLSENGSYKKPTPAQEERVWENCISNIADLLGLSNCSVDNLATNENGLWKKVVYLKEGMEIAINDAESDKAVFDKIAKIEILPEEQVYDIEVDGTHNFIGNDIVAHNTYIGGTASTTNLIVSGQTTLATSLTGLIKATSGVVSAITTSLGLAGEISDETGSGALVFGTSPTFTTQITTPSIISAGALGITPASGSNLNVNLAGAGDFAVNTNQLYVDTSTGNVGIGTTTPGTKLQIEGSGYLNSSLTLKNTASSGSEYSVIYFDDADANLNNWISYQHRDAGGAVDAFRFGIAGDEKVRITSTGNVGIGTTTPGAKLHTLATTEQLRLGYDASNYWSGTVGSTGGLTLAGTGTGGALSLTPTAGQNLNVNLAGTGDLAVNTNQLYVDTSTGNVGIGTVAPNTTLEVLGTQGTITTAIRQLGLLNIYDDTAQAAGVGGGITFGGKYSSAGSYSAFGAIKGQKYDSSDTYAWGNLAFYTSSAAGILSQKMLIDTSGNVGIGTTAPGVRLDVAGGTLRVQDTGMASSGKGLELIYIPGTDNGYVQAYNRDTSAYKVLNLEGSNVLLNPNSGGNVGIGTTTPNAKLSVYGNIELQGVAGGNKYLFTDEINTGTGKVVVQAGGGSASYGGALNLFANAHATKPGWVTAGLSVNGQAGVYEPRFTVNSSALAGGTDVFTVLQSGNVGIGTTAPMSLLDIYGSQPIVTLSDNGAVGARNWRIKSSANNWGSFAIQQSTTNLGSTYVDKLSIDENGNVGIGTTTPWRTLSVTGTVGFDGLTSAVGAGSLCLDSNKQVVYNSASDACLSSTRATKHDIAGLAVNGLSLISQLQPSSFIYNQGDGRTRYGFIAEDTALMDDKLATHNEKGEITGVDDRAIMSVAVKAIKELNLKVSDLEANASVSGGQTTDSLFSWILGKFSAIGIMFGQDKLGAKKGVFESFEMKDATTGEDYCVKIRNGEWEKTKGTCGETSLSSSSSVSSSSSNSSSVSSSSSSSSSSTESSSSSSSETSSSSSSGASSSESASSSSSADSSSSSSSIEASSSSAESSSSLSSVASSSSSSETASSSSSEASSSSVSSETGSSSSSSSSSE